MNLLPAATGLELHLTSPVQTSDTIYPLRVNARGEGAAGFCDGGSIRVRSGASGLVEEIFFDEQGIAATEVHLAPESDNVLQLTLCDSLGSETLSVPVIIRHTQDPHVTGRVSPTEVLTRAVHIEVLNRQGQRVRQVIAPRGAPLPGVFRCTCRTLDQVGRIVIPILEDDRALKQVVVPGLDLSLPIGAAVDIEVRIDDRDAMAVHVRVNQVNRTASALLGRQRCPTAAEIEELRAQIESLLGTARNDRRTQVQARVDLIVQAMQEAQARKDETAATMGVAELSRCLEELQAAQNQELDPPWQRFVQLVRHCLVESGGLADRTGRPREELFEQVYAQERYAEKAHEERNQSLYTECYENLSKFAGYLEQLRIDIEGPSLISGTDGQTALRNLAGLVRSLRSKVKVSHRRDLDSRLDIIERQMENLTGRSASLKAIDRLDGEVRKVEHALRTSAAFVPDVNEGLLEGAG